MIRCARSSVALHLAVWAACVAGADRVWAGCPNPQYQWTQTLGGNGEDHAAAIAVDASDNVVVAGHFSATVDFDPGPGVESHTSQGRADVFITKFAADGSHLWTRTLGGPGEDQAYDVTLDGAGNVLMAGRFHSTVDFDPTAGVDSHSADGAYEDFFVTKLAADGSYVWTRTAGAAGSDRAWSVAVDTGENVLVSGTFRYTVDFDPTTGSDEHISNGGYDVFVGKYAADGAYLWTKTIGGTVSDWCFAMAADSSDNVVLAGGFTGATVDVDFDPGPGQDIHSGGGAFVTRLAGDGSYGWTRTFGSSNYAVCWGVATDAQGNVMVTGTFNGGVDFNPPYGVTRTPDGPADTFLVKYNADSSFAWVYTAGAGNFDGGYDVAVASDGDVLVTGYYDMTPDFDPGTAQDKQATLGWRDIFVTRLGGDGSYLWTRTAGGTAYDDAGHAVAVSPSGAVFYAGRFESTTVDFYPGGGTDNHTSVGQLDVFVSKLLCD